MLNVNDPIIKRFMENLHNSVERRIRRKLSDSSSYDDSILENRMLKIFCEDKLIEPHRCADQLNSRYNYNLSGDRVIQVLRFLHLTYQSRRAELLDWAAEMVDALVKALSTRTAKDFDAFIALRDKKFPNRDRNRDRDGDRDRDRDRDRNRDRDGDRDRDGNRDRNRDRDGDRDGGTSKIQIRLACLMLYVKHPELDRGNDTEIVEKCGNAHMKYFFVDWVDFLRNICINNRRNNREKRDAAQERIELLENMLNRSDMMLKDLQDEFDDKIRESHQNEMIEFFSLLNSEKYGCILDAVLSVRNGVRKLRKENVQLPPEIGGLLILIERLAHFIRDNKINPILKPGSVQDMRFDEVEACDYEGSPFDTTDQIKHVKVLSPGWFYQNKDVQIARPRLKEVANE
ncbi:MAG: hypothetical protein IJ774_02980 [Selenomonadaceae bacterium]|nr:hypothetical protein [Selenomonadaceae bacterium]